MATSDMGSNPVVAPTVAQRRKFAAGMRDQGIGTLLNAKPACFRRTRAKLGQVLAGTANAVFATISDSNWRATDGTNDPTQGANGVPAQLAKVFGNHGFKANAENVHGYGGYEQAFATYDSRVSVTGSFNKPAGGGIRGLGGQIFSASAAGTLTFTVPSLRDKFELPYLDNGAVLNYTVDGGSAVVVNTGNTSTIKKVTIDLGTVAAHTVVVSWVSGSVYVYGYNAFESASKRVDILNGGWHGSRTQQWVDGATPSSFWNYDRYLDFVGADLVIMALTGTNDWRAADANAVPVETFSSNLASMLAKLKAIPSQPEILVVTSTPDGNAIAGSNIANQRDYGDAAIACAFDADVPVLDVWRTWGDEPSMRTWGAMSSDKLHTTRGGKVMIAQAVYEAIMKP